MSETVNVVIAGTPTPIYLFDQNSLLAVEAAAEVAAFAATVYSDAAGNFGFGTDVGSAITTGDENVFLGYLAGRDVSTGSYNVMIGRAVAYRAAGALNNVIIGHDAMFSALGANHSNTAIGKNAGYTFNGNELTAVGYYALHQTTGVANTAVGANAGGAITTGARNTLLGYSANGGAALNDSIALGYNAAYTRSGEIVIGTSLQDYLRVFGIDIARWQSSVTNMWLGDGGPTAAATGAVNLFVGREAGNSLTTGSSNVGIGPSALESQTTGNSTVAVGGAAAQFGTGLIDCTYVGALTGRSAVSGVGTTAVGYRAAEKETLARNTTALGDSAGWMGQGQGNTLAGYTVAEYKQAGDQCVIIGIAAGIYRLDGDDCVFIGARAGSKFSESGLINTSTGLGATAIGDRLIGIGTQALEEHEGNDAIGIGYRAGLSATSGDDSIYIGANAGNNGSQKVDAANSIALGADAFTTKDNQVVLGNSSITETVIRGVQRGTTFTVAGLPSAATMGAGARAFVTDATVTTFASIVAGGGANGVPCYSDGTNWRIG